MTGSTGPWDANRDARRSFATTCWTLVANAGQAPSPETHQALSQLCENYWYPLYAYVRRRGYSAPEAQDLTQEFFCRLLERNTVRIADRTRGKFRTFLLTALNHFLANEWRDLTTQKRGGRIRHLSWDFVSAEQRWTSEPTDDLTPERSFERRWAMTLLDRTLGRLADEYRAVGKGDLFEQIRSCLGGEVPERSYRDIGEMLGMTEGAVKVAAYRVRQRCRELLRAEISETVSDPESLDDELQTLFRAVSATSSRPEP